MNRNGWDEGAMGSGGRRVRTWISVPFTRTQAFVLAEVQSTHAPSGQPQLSGAITRWLVGVLQLTAVRDTDMLRGGHSSSDGSVQLASSLAV